MAFGNSSQLLSEFVWPELSFTWQLVLGSVIGFVGAALGTVGGAGGGSIRVPMLSLIIGFDVKTSRVLSKCGCGACLVLLSKYDPHSKQLEELTINSCLTLLCSIDGCAITTTEGLGNTQKGFHAVHERIAGFHGSQCGFCTPGMCISIYSCLRRAQSKKLGAEAHDVLHTLPQLSAEEAQKSIVGNLCRCTGYRPILDTCKSFAGDVDLEDLGVNTFWSSNKEANATLLPAYSPSLDPVFPKFLIEELEARHSIERTAAVQESANVVKPARMHLRYVDGGEERFWIAPSTLEDVFKALRVYHGRHEVKLVVGNTSAGIYKDRKPQVFIDISQIPELLVVRERAGGIEVGAAVTIEKLIHTLEAKSTTDESVFHGIVSHLKRVANPAVRNRASVGGNLIMAQQLSFDSDLATVFLAVGVTLKLTSANTKHSSLSMEEFLQKGSLDPGTVLESIFIPSWQGPKIEQCLPSPPAENNESSKEMLESPTTKHVFKSYRAAPRPLGNAVAYIHAAFLAEVSLLSTNETDGNGRHDIQNVRLAFGAFGHKHAIRAHKVENFVIGKVISPDVLLKAIEMLKVEYVVPARGTRKAGYRSSVAVGFFFDFFGTFLPEVPMQYVIDKGIKPSQRDEAEPCHNNHQDNNNNNSCVSDYEPEATFKHLKKSKDQIFKSGKQIVPVFDEYHPLGKPMQKSEAKIQAAGEAIYVDDIPAPENALFAAFVLSEKALAKIKHVDVELALASPGVVSYISADDIPKGGVNLGTQGISAPENLFASEMVEFVGHPLGVVVADTPQHAKDAAMKVRVDYDSETLGSPVLSIEDATDTNSYFSFVSPLSPIGDVSRGFSEADQKIEGAEVRTGSQYFFYMENQTALAVPDEDDCMVVYSSSQDPETLQRCISTCLGVPSHNIRAITRRVGGGFGGKATRNITVAAACAVAAYKLRHPVRMYLDRNTDMIMMGGRHPTKTIYSVGFTSTGKVTALQAKVFIEAGWSEDFSLLIPIVIMGGLKKYNWGSVDVEFKLCKTNLASKSTMRAPGHVQGSFIADTVIKHVAAVLELDVNTVIERNMHTLNSATAFYCGADVGGTEGYTLPSVWKMMKKLIESREKAVQNFNHINRWLKRGLAITPCIYDVEQFSKPARVSIFSDASVVVEVGGIEIGQGLWTKVKQATIFGLGQIWQDGGHAESWNVRVVQADSISLPNGGWTAGSTASEGSCEAVRQACKILVSRLMPTKIKAEQVSLGGISWLELIKKAKLADVDLSAQVHWFPGESTKRYLNYGAAASEVEIDVLTGETTILQTDLIYDCGKSLNPAIDIGQIEGSFVQGIGFFMTEEHVVDNNGKVISDGTWTYKPPTIDNIPHQFNVEILNGVVHHDRILSSKACGEPPLVLAGSVHAAIRHAIEAAREDVHKISTGDQTEEGRFFRFDAPATIDKVKTLCGLESVEEYLKYLARNRV